MPTDCVYESGMATSKTRPCSAVPSPAAAPPMHRNAPAETVLQRRASIPLNSYDAKARTAEAVLSAGSAVKRWGFIEKLEISRSAIDLSRAEQGLVSLLDTHNAYELDAVLGSVRSIRIEGGKLIGKLHFADTEPGRMAEGMVQRGELRGVSIGYRVTRWAIAEADGDALETRTATGWELLEVSLVPVPADADAGIRSIDPSRSPSNNETPAKEPTMSMTAAQGIALIDTARTFGARVETIARTLIAKVDAGEISADAARAEILQAAGEAQNARTEGIRAGGSMSLHNESTLDNPTYRAAAMSNAIFSRMAGKEPDEQARDFMRLSIPQMAAEILVQRGERDVHRMSAHQAIAGAWHRDSSSAAGYTTTFDLPAIMQDSANRFLMDKFAAFESPIKQLAKRRSANDFREITGIDLSGIGELEKVNESGEIKFGYFKDRKEKYRLATYAKRFALTRQAIVNDDLAAFSDALVILARAAAQTEASLFADLVNSNPAMADGNAVFHADHGNLAAAGAAPSVTTLDQARQGMRGQKDLDGTPVIVQPRYVLAPPEYETSLEQLLASTIAATKTADTNPFSGKLEPVIDPRLDPGSWYVLSDPGVAAAIEFATLNDIIAPHIEMNENWDTLGTGYRAFHDFGCAFIDSRGAWKNPGA